MLKTRVTIKGETASCQWEKQGELSRRRNRLFCTNKPVLTVPENKSKIIKGAFSFLAWQSVMMPLAQTQEPYELMGAGRQSKGAWSCYATCRQYSAGGFHKVIERLSWMCTAQKTARVIQPAPGWGLSHPGTHLNTWMMFLFSLFAEDRVMLGARCPLPLETPATVLAVAMAFTISLHLLMKDVCNLNWGEKGLSLFPETYLSLGWNSWLLFLDYSRKLLSNSKQHHVLAYIFPHLSLCQNVSFA